jgi:hypothetical protein
VFSPAGHMPQNDVFAHSGCLDASCTVPWLGATLFGVADVYRPTDVADSIRLLGLGQKVAAHRDRRFETVKVETSQ